MKKGMFDISLFIAIILLVIFGIVMIYSSSSIWAEYKFNDAFRYVKAQTLFAIVGFILMYILSHVHYSFYKEKANMIITVCFILLVLVLIPGIGTVRNGSRSWFGIGPFGIQPSEFAKLGLIIFVSRYLTNSQKEIKKFFEGLFPVLVIILIFFGLIMLQPDFGTGVVLVISVFSLLFVSGVHYKFFTQILILGGIGLIGLIVAAPYRMARITSFLDPWRDPLGTGFLNSRQKHFFLPEPQTDFIFSIISEELGFLGVIIVVGFFLFIFSKSIKISRNATDLFAKYLSFGISFQIIVQALINLAVVVGLIPVTGITLPFLSYGGSSLLMSLTGMGIILGISRYQK
jgi:cell division protein FtsW